MGSMYEWSCESCGAGERFSCGGGMLSYNEPSVISRAGEGAYGEAMARLLQDGVPDGWSVFRSQIYWLCPECDATFEGTELSVNDRGEGKLIYRAAPGTCPACGWELVDETPMSEADISDRCMSRQRDGCPKCGGRTVTFTFGNWD